MGLCEDLLRDTSGPSGALLVLWRHAVGRGETLHAQLHPRRKLLSVLLSVGRGRVCRFNEPRSELRLDFKLTHLQGRVHLRRGELHSHALPSARVYASPCAWYQSGEERRKSHVDFRYGDVC